MSETMTVQLRGTPEQVAIVVQLHQMMFDLLQESQDYADPGSEFVRRDLEIFPPETIPGWTVDVSTSTPDMPASVVIHDDYGGMVVPLDQVQALREALAEAAGRLAELETILRQKRI